MAQATDFVVDDGSGASLLSQLNSMLAALASSNSGASAPPSPVAGMTWLDTGVSPAVRRVRNAANNAWLVDEPETIAAQTVMGNASGSAGVIQPMDMPTLRTLQGWAQTAAGNGYVRFPGGIIFQWMLAGPIASGANGVATWPIAFQSAVFSVVPGFVSTTGDANVGDNYICQIRTITTTNVTIRNLGPLNAAYFIMATGV